MCVPPRVQQMVRGVVRGVVRGMKCRRRAVEGGCALLLLLLLLLLANPWDSGHALGGDRNLLEQEMPIDPSRGG